MVEDKQLIRQYAAEQSEAAFAELVRRHLKMVYAAALRQVNGDRHLAEDVTQAVFADLARKAKTLQRKGSIVGWLFVSTRFAAANAVRAEARRRVREQEVVMRNEIAVSEDEVWNKLRPLIDEALGELGEVDRESIALRFFQGYEFSLVGAALGVSENAARMRVERALEKLRVVLQKRGLATTGAALGAALAEATGGNVPAQLAGTITKAALVQTGLAVAATPSILNLLAMNKLAVTGVGLAVCALVGLMVLHKTAILDIGSDVSAIGTTAKGTLNQNAEMGIASEMEAVTNAFKRTVEGHDAQVRARQAEEEANWFDEHVKEVPGLMVFGASARASLHLGETLVTGGWLTKDGERILVLITPCWIDPAETYVTANPASNAAPEELRLRASTLKNGGIEIPLASGPLELTMETKYVTVSENTLTNLGLKNFYVPQTRSTVSEKFQYHALVESIQQTSGSEMLSCPRPPTLAGQAGHTAVQEEIMIGGQKLIVGPAADVTASISSDGTSVDVQVKALYIDTAPGADYTAVSPTAKPGVVGN
jgi:RNA polymerase sigma factor (sigma-70 family)